MNKRVNIRKLMLATGVWSLIAFASFGQAALSIEKSVNEANYSAEGDILHYTIVVTNTGNFTLTNVGVTDPNSILTCAGAPYTLAPNDSRTCTAVHTVIPADIIAGTISNTAAASGSGPDMAPVTGISNTVIIPMNNLPPTITCPPSVNTNTSSTTCTALLNTGLSAINADPDNNIVSLTWVMTGASIALSPPAGINNLTNYTFNSGVTTVTYTVTDALGLSATCSFTVTVIDNVIPTVDCVSALTRSTDLNLPAYTVVGTEFDPTSSWDNCSIASVTNSYNGIQTLAGAKFPMGVTSVIWTISDNSGNKSTCSFTVTITDNQIPVTKCRNISIILDINTGIASITASEVDGGSYDNVAISSMTVSKTTFNCSDIGPDNVILTVTDNSGNIGTCTAIVTVNYAVVPNPIVTPVTEVFCDGESTNLVLTSSIPVTSWTWSVNSSSGISGAVGDNTGMLSLIKQTLTNSDSIVRNVIYNITPKLYGRCNLSPISSNIWVNPIPKILVSSKKTTVCNGESTTITVLNANLTVRGQWMYDMIITADAGISGNTVNGTYETPTNLSETLTNSDIIIHKVVYRFLPRIVPDDGGSDCLKGIEKTMTIWVYPSLSYTKEISDYNGFNISCYGKSNGYIRLNPTGALAPLTFSWSGPDVFNSSTKNISGLSAGQFSVIIVDKNMCTTKDAFVLTEPKQLSMTLKPSISSDGAYNINCAGEKGGSVTVSAVNNVGLVDYLWIDGNKENVRTNLSAGTYKVVITDANSCQADSAVTLTEPDLLNIAFDMTQPLCPDKPDGEIRLTVTGGAPGSVYAYLWSDNTTGRNLSNILPGFYKVTASDLKGCSIKDSLQVKPIYEFCLFIPEAISPNGDLVNDVWNIGNIDLYSQVEITIYNRWGQEVWRSERGYPFPWDGKSKGVSLPLDSYHYTIDLHNGSKIFVRTITIVR